ncbi:MAG: glycoside hydrolase family 92 protein, partial [Bacteroidota bacterium]|nr:glycoside hydrolase family 92 protein [Bacteroidota bacterium]
MNLVRNVLLLLILIVFSNINVKGQNVDNIDDIYNFINPFIGTSGDGHTYPGATVPFGMVQLSPDTYIGSYKNSYNWCSGYQYNDSSIIGFSHTHFSGTGHSDMGDILIMPTVGSIQLNKGDKENPDKGYRSRYDKNSEFSEPGYYFVFLSDYKIKAELTATNRVGVHKYSFPETKDAHIIIDLESSIYNYNEKIIWNEMRVNSNTQIIGSHQTRGWARNRHIYYAIEFSKPFKSWGHINSDDSMYGHKKSDKIYMNKSLIQGRKIKAVLNFDTKKNEVIVVKVGISAVSMAGALKNLNAEVPAFDFN